MTYETFHFQLRSEKGGLMKRSPVYGRGSIFGRLGEKGEGGRGGPRGGGRSVFGRLNFGGGMGQQWHKVTIPHGGTQNQDWLIKNLQSGMDATLKPVNVRIKSTSIPPSHVLTYTLTQIHVINDKLMFFVEDPRAANQLKRLGRMDTQDGSLRLIVKPCPPPRSKSL